MSQVTDEQWISCLFISTLPAGRGCVDNVVLYILSGYSLNTHLSSHAVHTLTVNKVVLEVEVINRAIYKEVVVCMVLLSAS